MTTTTELQTPCGCALTCNWPKGDRRLRCGHGRWWVVRKMDNRSEHHVLSKETFPE